MVGEEVDIFVSHLFAIHLFDAVDKQAAVQPDESLLRQFADERSDVLVFDIGIGVKFRPCGSILCYTIVGEELHLLECLTVFCVLLAVDDETLCHLIETLLHQCCFHLVLYVFHLDVILDVQVGDDLRHCPQIGRLVDTLECLEDGIHYLVEGEPFLRPVTLGDCEVLYFHCLAFIFRR